MFSTKNTIRILGLLLLLALIVPTASSLTETTANSSNNIITPEITATPSTEDVGLQTQGDRPVKDLNNEIGFDRTNYKHNSQTDYIGDVKPITQTPSRDLPDPVMTLVNGSTDTGAITQNEFVLYDFEVTDVNGSAVTIYVNFTNSAGDWLEVMLDDAAGNTLDGVYGYAEVDATLEADLEAGTYYIILFGAEVLASLSYEIELGLEAIVELPPDGSSLAGSYEMAFNVSKAFQLSDNSSGYEWISSAYPSLWSYVPAGHIIIGDYTGSFWAMVTIEEGQQYNLNVTLDYDGGDVGLWYQTDIDHDPFLYGSIVSFDDASWTGSGHEEIFIQNTAPGNYFFCVAVWEVHSVDIPLNITLNIEQTLYTPIPLSSAIDVAVGDEISFAGAEITPYNMTLTANHTYLLWIGEPDTWFVDNYGAVPWDGNFDNDLYLEIYSPTGVLVDEEDDSQGEWDAWLTPWLSRYTPTETGEYSFLFGPFDGVTYSVGSLQVVDMDWVLVNAPDLAIGTGSGMFYWNSTTDEVNILDIYTFEVTTPDQLHVVSVDDTYGDDIYYQGNILYDENWTLVTDSGFRTASNYGESYANPSLAEVLPVGTYCYVLWGWYALDADVNETYSIHHDVYDVTTLGIGDNVEDTMGATGEAYFVLEPNTNPRWNFWTVSAIPGDNVNVSLELWDLDFQFAREIVDYGGDNVTASINYMGDTIDLGRDGSSYGKKLAVVKAENGDAFNVSFATWAPTPLTSANGLLDSATNTNDFYKFTSAGGDYVFDFTSNDTDGNVWVTVGSTAGGTVAAWFYTEDIDILTLAAGDYYFWVCMGEASKVPGLDEDHNYLKNGPYGRIGWLTDYVVEFTLSIEEFAPPAAEALAINAEGLIDGAIDAQFSIALTAGQTYYFWWDDAGMYDYDAVLFDHLGNPAVSGEDGWNTFIYTPLFAGTYNLWLHEYNFDEGDSSVVVREAELVDEHTPDHIVSQWYYDFDLDTDKNYLIYLEGNSYTYMGNLWYMYGSYTEAGIVGDNFVFPWNYELDFFAWVYGSFYAYDYAGQFTMRLYELPHVTEITVVSEVPTTVTEATTEIVQTTIPGAGQTVTTTKTESPGFELLVFLLAIPALFLIRKRRS